MPKLPLAIASCRVSTPEQRLNNNSLNRQEQNVLKASSELNTEIVKWWSGDISSKAGTNVKRRDLKEMQDFCKQNRRVKYLIVDEPDRFMRSVDEAFYFEVLFRELGVKVWYASDPALNGDDLMSKMLKFSKYFPAEGSNVERITKSISGQTAALKDGRWTFVPKPGYIKGREKGIPEIHPTRGPTLRKVLIEIASHSKTPSQALVDLNNSEFMSDGHSFYKMDKFRKIVIDPFYAGILEVNKQVQVRNENGLHEPLITREQHLEIVRIMNGKPRNQSGPRKNGNPKYPANNIVHCDQCLDKKNGRVVGFDHTNGKSSKVYEKYRCRACGRYINRQELHDEISKQFQKCDLSPEATNMLVDALNIVWKQKKGQVEQEITRIKIRINSVNNAINQQVEAATDPSNTSIKEEILEAISKKKQEVKILEEHLRKLQLDRDNDKAEFIKFAFNFVSDMGTHFLELSHENRMLCKQIIFPAGFHLGADKKVYTPEISPLIRLAASKKDAEASQKSQMVRVRRL